MSVTVYRGESEAAHLAHLMDWADSVIFNAWSNTNRPNFWIAGGAPLDYFRGETPKDFDLWFPDEDAFDVVINTMVSQEMRMIKSTKGSVVYQSPSVPKNLAPGQYDLVRTRWFDSPEDTVDFFDITVSGIAVGHDFVTFHEKFFEHLATGAMVFNNLQRPLNTLRRIPKYSQKGFLPSDDQLEKLAERISMIDMDDETQNLFKWLKKDTNDAGDVYANLPKSTISNNSAKIHKMALPPSSPSPSSAFRSSVGSFASIPVVSNSGIPAKKGIWGAIKKLSEGGY